MPKVTQVASMNMEGRGACCSHKPLPVLVLSFAVGSHYIIIRYTIHNRQGDPVYSNMLDYSYRSLFRLSLNNLRTCRYNNYCGLS